MEEAVGERGKAFAAAHRNNEDRQAYTSASRRASSAIAKANAEAWQATCSSLSLKSIPKSVYSALCSVPDSSSSSPNCSSPWKLASVFVDYLRYTFLFPSQKPCVAESEATFLSSAEPRFLRSFIRLSALPFPLLNFLRLSQISFVHCHWPRQNCLPHAKASSSL